VAHAECATRVQTAALVGISAVVGRRSVEADIVELDLADIQNVESLNHVTRSFESNNTESSKVGLARPAAGYEIEFSNRLSAGATS
jgi:hypothetical protein